jgi:hypothetical protein
MAKKTTTAQLEREIKDVLSRKLPSHMARASTRKSAELLEEAAYAVFKRVGGEDLTRAEFHEEVLGLLHQPGFTSAELNRHIDTLYKRIYGDV